MQLNAQKTRLFWKEVAQDSRISLASIRSHAWTFCPLFTGNYVQLGDHGAITHRFFSSLFLSSLISAAALSKSANRPGSTGLQLETFYSFSFSF